MHRRLLYPATPTHAPRRCRLDPTDSSGLPAGVVQRKKRSASGGDQATPRASSRTDESPGSRLGAETHADSFLRPQPLAFRKNQPAVDPPPPRFWRIFLAVVLGQKSSRFGAGWTDSCAASCTNRATLGSKRPRNRSQSRPNTTGAHIRQVSVGRATGRTHRPDPPSGPSAGHARTGAEANVRGPATPGNGASQASRSCSSSGAGSADRLTSRSPPRAVANPQARIRSGLHQ